MEYAPGPAVRGGANDQNPQPEPERSEAPQQDNKPDEKAEEKSKDKAEDKPKDKPKEKPKKKSTDDIRREMIKEARKGLGTPYVWGGNTPNGWDCSGYTRYVYNKIGIKIPRHSSAQMRAGRIVSEKEAKPGDIIWVKRRGAKFVRYLDD